MAQENQVKYFRATIYPQFEGVVLIREEFHSWLKRNAQEWSYQVEECPTTKRPHWQIKMKWGHKIRAATIAVQFRATFNDYKGSVTITPEVKGNNNDFYTMKEETRMEGPWRWDDKTAIVIPLRYQIELCAYQQTIKKSYDCWNVDSRACHVIVDPQGNNWKSTVGEYLTVHEMADLISVAGMSVKQIIEAAAASFIANPKLRGYIFDMERANKNNDEVIFSAIERIKSGIIRDERFGDRPRVIMEFRPVIWVFMNRTPEAGVLSKDRWRLWTINDYGEFNEDHDVEAKDVVREWKKRRIDQEQIIQ